MITFSKFGKHGRLGNQLFQYAAALGISNKLRRKLILPHWELSDYFDGPYPGGEMPNVRAEITEKLFEYDPRYIERVKHLPIADLHGYFQTEKYWSEYKPLIKNMLVFKKEIIDQVRRKQYAAFKKQTIAIHVRRGDYVDNKNYELLPAHYYIMALFENFPNWQEYNIIVFGDDMGYCKLHFDCLPNVFFAEGNSPIEDIALMTQCTHFIIANSSFSFWGAYLGEKKGTKIVRPSKYFAGPLLERCPLQDLYPAHWIAFNHTSKRINLKDVTFTIPVAYDHKDRKKNLDLTVCMLQHFFDTKIVIAEQGGTHFEYMGKYPGVSYFSMTQMKSFHRTQMLNIMAGPDWCKTPYVANWDADVMVPPLQLLLTVQALRNGADMAYPYGRNFARVPRLPWFEKLEKYMDIGIFGDTKFNGMNNGDAVSYGGAVLFHVGRYWAGGGENENFVSFGPEDAERFYRFTKLEFDIWRTPGTLYHINHYVGTNSSNRHAHVSQNRAEWEHIQLLNTAELCNYIEDWPWCKEYYQKLNPAV